MTLWIATAVGSEHDQKDKLFDEIIALRDKVKAFNLPYLALPTKTPKEVALDVFIKMNTSSVCLSTYDIVVALVEEETGKSLHAHVDALNMSVPRASEYADLPGLVLDVVALRQDCMPSQVVSRGIGYARMMNEWDMVVKGIKGMVRFLEDECIFDTQRLPSYTALPILAALWEHLPTQPDQLGNARHLLPRRTRARQGARRGCLHLCTTGPAERSGAKPHPGYYRAASPASFGPSERADSAGRRCA
jgi:hypothetical protein